VPGVWAARVVAVIAETESGRKVGSGYLLDAAHILTAWHCTVDESEQSAAVLYVKRAEGESTADVAVIESTSKLDIALLEVSGDPPWGAELPGGSIVFGKLDREQGGQIDCYALGFPRWQADGDFRDVAEVHGPVYLTEGRELRRAVLRSPVLDSVSSDGGPAWAGFSGAAVFHGGLLIGVVIEHHPRQGASALQFRPIGVVADDDGDSERRVARALGIDSPSALRQVTTGSAPAQPDVPVASSPGWSLSSDRERGRHWEPRARGASKPGEQVWWFRGRQEALSRVRSWLDWDSPSVTPQVLVVTGAPGAGKSAVLARVVTSADPEFRASMPPDDPGVMASVGSVSCAVHARGKTALEVAAEIAAAAAVEAPEELEDLVLAVSRSPAGTASGRFNVLIDAVDEAVSTAQARTIIDSVILPLAETCAGVRVIAGTRARDDEGDLVGRFGRALDLVDLDAPEYFREQDLVDYALAWLQLRGSAGPYADQGAARPLAETIARAAGRNFLVAGLVARDHGLYDREAADHARLEPVTSVRTALERDLRRLTGIGDLPARRLLTALAFAEAPGLTAALWKAAVEALPQGGVNEAWPVQVRPEQLDAFARSLAANFLVETQGEVDKDCSSGRSYQLLHQALGDALLAAREELVDRAVDEEALARAFLREGHATGWDRAPGYLLRSLPAHAARAGLVDALLGDDEYLLHSDLSRLIQVGGQAVSAPARNRARLLGLTPESVTAGPAERAALFSVTEALDGLGTAYRNELRPVSYRALWASTKHRYANLTLKVSEGWIGTVCTVDIGDRTLLVGGGAGKIRLWDPSDGTEVRTLVTDYSGVNAICSVVVGGRSLLAAGGQYGTVQLWDPADGTEVRTLYMNCSGVRSICAVCELKTDDRTLLAAVCYNGLMQVWDPADGSPIRTTDTHHNRAKVESVCVVDVGGRALIVVGGDPDGVVHLWDPVSGTQIRTLDINNRLVTALCTAEVSGRALIAVGSHGGQLELWDPSDGTEAYALNTHSSGVQAVCPVRVSDRTLLAVFDDDGRAQLWDPAIGTVRTLNVRHSSVQAVCAVEASGRNMVATAGGYSHGDQWRIQLWDLRPGFPDSDSPTLRGWVGSVCVLDVDGSVLLAAGGHKGKVQLWDPANGTPIRTLKTHYEGGSAVCAVKVGERVLLAVSGSMLRLWDPTDGTIVRTLNTRDDWVGEVCAVKVNGRTLLAGGLYSGNVRLWDPANGTVVGTLNTRHDSVGNVCAVEVGGRVLLAVSGHEGKVQLWDPANGTKIRTLNTQHRAVQSICTVKDRNRTLLATGGSEGKVRLWDPVKGTEIRTLNTQHRGVRAICTVKDRNRTFLATGGDDDGTVQLWDPEDGRRLLTVPVHYAVISAASVANSLAVGLEAGVLVIGFDADFIGIS